jgi:hypothetical protein
MGADVNASPGQPLGKAIRQSAKGKIMTWRRYLPRIAWRAGRIDLIERRAFHCYLTKFR